MSAPPAERAAFWDARILSWESWRYSAAAALNPCAWTVRRRMEAARRLVATEHRGAAEVVDLGCGTGLLAEAVLAGPGRRYLGVDLSGVAVEAARRRFAAHADRARFERRDALDGGWDAPLVVFLGLLDWLDDAELDALFAGLRAPRLLFSFTEARAGAAGFLYGGYRRARDGAQRARTVAAERVAAAAAAGGYRVERVLRLSALDPGRLATAVRR